MKKVLAIVLALGMVFCLAACGNKEEEAKDLNAKSEGSMTAEQYQAAADGADVVIEGYVTAKVYSAQYGNMNLVLQDGTMGYFVYRMPATDSDNEAIEIGQKVQVKGVKTAWKGEVEIKEGTATYTVIDDKYTDFAAADITATLAKADDVLPYQNMLVAVKDAEVKEAPKYNWDGNGQEGSDLYVTLTISGVDYSFLVETDLCDGSSDTYKAVQAWKVGDKVSFEGVCYWYDAPQLWITAVK